MMRNALGVKGGLGMGVDACEGPMDEYTSLDDEDDGDEEEEASI